MVYLWRKPSDVVAGEAAGSPHCVDVNILITVKCTRMAGVRSA